MAYKVLKTFDVSADDQLATATEAYLLSDPRINTLYTTGLEGQTYEDVIRFAKQLYCTDNIRDNPLIFTNLSSTSEARGAAAHYANFNLKFIEKVPQDLHCWSFYLNLSYDDYYRTEIHDLRGVPQWSSDALSASYSSATRVYVDQQTYWDNLIIYLSGIRDFFSNNTWNLIKVKKSKKSTHVPYNAFGFAIQVLCSRSYIHRRHNGNQYTGTTCTASEAMGILNESVDANLSYRDGAWLLTCPISVKNKSTLYHVFPSTTDVCTILGSGAAKKKVVKKGDKEIKHDMSRFSRLYGVELELTTDLTTKQMIDAQGEEVFFLLKQDGSITGAKTEKYECVTKPMALPDHRVLWSRFFSRCADKAVFDQSTTTNNGMHVHIHKDCFKNDHLQKFAWFITNPAHFEFFLQISQRTAESLSRWAPMPNYATCRNEEMAYKECLRLNAAQRGAVNTGNTRGKGTCEIRLFKGIVSCSEVIRNLEVVDSVFEFTQVTPRRHLTLKNYYAWVKSTPRTQYKLLRADLFKLEMDKLIKKAEVIRLVFGLTDPDKIVDRINTEQDRTVKLSADKRFVVDTLVFATLTKLLGRRVFGINEDGLLTVKQKNVGRLAHLDVKTEKVYSNVK
jgi:hypothetical protein